MKAKSLLMSDHPLVEVVEEFSRFLAPDLIAKIGGLQLMPENAAHAARLELAACAATAVRNQEQQRCVSANDLRAILSKSSISDQQLIMQEDPVGGWFVESVTFTGGAYLVLPGITTNATFILRHLAMSLALSKKPFSNSDFTNTGCRLFRAVLAVSDATVRRAKLSRGIHTVERSGEATIMVPKMNRLQALADAVQFTPGEFTELLRSRSANLSDLEPLITEAGELAIEKCDPHTHPLQVTPIVRTDEFYIVASPSLLLPALRHQIICMAKKHSTLSEISERLNAAAWHTAAKCFRYMGMTTAGPSPCSRPAIIMEDGLFSFDTDKAMYVCVIGDDLKEYDEEVVFGNAPRQDLWPILRSHLEDVFNHLASESNPPNELLCAILTHSIGRFWGVGVGKQGEELPYELLLMGVADLEVITRLEGGDPLFLWKFAKARRRLRDRTEVIGVGTLNEYGLFRDRNYSFYLSDEAAPTVFSIGFGWDGPVEQESLDKVDPHGVLSYDGRHVSEVVALHGNRDVPIFVQESNLGERTALLVEGYSIPLWVVAPSREQLEHSGNHAVLAMLADMIGFWMWQFTPSLKPWFDEAIGERCEAFAILIDADECLEADGRTTASENAPFDVEYSPDRAQLLATFHNGITGLLDGPGNDGEMEVMTALLQAMRNTCENSPVSRQLEDNRIQQILKRHVGPRTKKKVIITHTNRDPELDPRGLPTELLVSPIDEDELLDELGEFLRSDQSVEPGPIPDELRSKVLNRAVDYYYNMFKDLVGSLAPHGLLEWCVAHHEAILRRTAFQRLVLPTQLACYVAYDELCNRWAKESSDLSKSALAARFIIEYVVACPPTGIRPMSAAVYERLLTLASEIIQVGFQSDVIHLGLSDAKLSLLPSGRLGRNFDSYEEASRIFMASYAAHDVARAGERFGRTRSQERKPPSVLMTELDSASRAEFGHTVTEIGECWMAAAAIAQASSIAAYRVPIAKLVEQLVTALGCDETKVRSIIQEFSLTQRSEFFCPPSCFRQEDMYPWRFTRRYSYIRRPFLLMDGPEEQEIVIGHRHLHRSWRYLLHLCFDGRMQASRPEMKALISRINNEAAEAFNDRVADEVGKCEGMTVKRRVKKTDKLKGTSAPLGDIDVLAADRRRRKLMVVECKDLALARTPREMAQQLEALFEGSGSKKSTVEKHASRVDWARKHLPGLLEWLGLGWSPKWSVEALIVLDHCPMCALLTESPMPVVSLNELLQRLE